jgi:hypothetical protein
MGGGFWYTKKTHAEWVDIHDAQAGMQLLRNAMDSTSTDTLQNKRDLLVAFCNATYTYANGFMDGETLRYSPKYSLFIASLCSPLVKEISFAHPEIIRKTSREGITWFPRPSCDPAWSMEFCNLAELISDIFKEVMNDHGTLGLAWWVLTEKKEPEELVKQFSDTYFGDQAAVCKDPKWTYISQKSSSNVDGAICFHPQTYSTLIDTISSLQKQAQRLTILDAEKLKILPHDACDSIEKSDLFACSYAFEQSEALTARQNNLWHNEILYYHALIAWLSTKLEDPKFAPFSLESKQYDYEASWKKWDLREKKEMLNANGTAQIWLLQREIWLSTQALASMQQTITNFRATFPIHIGLLAYREDTVAMRKALTKVYTPIHQLYYKLRNVQKK